MRRHSLTLLLFALLSVSVLASAAQNKRDGNWWLTLDAPTRQVYVTGLFDGTLLGRNFSVWGGVPEGKPILSEEGMNASVQSFVVMYKRYLEQVTSGQLADGLTEFYRDFRNRSIEVENAVWLVLNQIAGTPKQTVDMMIENFRRSAK